MEAWVSSIFCKEALASKIGVPVKSSEVKASMRDGILEIRLPKSDEAKPNRIKID